MARKKKGERAGNKKRSAKPLMDFLLVTLLVVLPAAVGLWLIATTVREWINMNIALSAVQTVVLGLSLMTFSALLGNYMVRRVKHYARVSVRIVKHRL